MFRAIRLLFKISGILALDAKEKPDKIGLLGLWRALLDDFLESVWAEEVVGRQGNQAASTVS